MRTFHGLDDLPSDFGPAVVSVGNFDGVHRAHQEVLRRVVDRARERKANSLAVTFEPHPMRILRPDIALKLLTPTHTKLHLLARTGLDATLVLPFTRDLSLTPPQDFAHQILARRLRAIEVHEGANFHFGHRAQGNVERLAEFGRKFGFDVVVYPEMRVRGESVSSSRIRELIRAGQVSRARRLLGRVFGVRSTAGRGRGYGHKFTVPTINLSRYDELVPGDGVYITRTRIGEVTFDSVSNVGMRPTFGGDSFAVESHLLHFEEMEISAETEVEVAFLFRLRPEIKFPSVEALREQIARDIRRAHRYFALIERHAPTAP